MPPGFHIFSGNRMESLAARLAEVLRNGLKDDLIRPLRPQTVMVQSKGMQRWVSMTIARLNGICANIDFPFPNALLEALYARVIGPLPEDSPYELHVLTFRILNILPDLLKRPEFNPLNRYLADQHRPLKLYQLAHKIADTFDQYVVYRPDLLSLWQKGHHVSADDPNVAWQAALWHELVRKTHSSYRSELQKTLVQRLSDPRIPLDMERLPTGLSVFGISYLPPFHLEVLQALAARIPVYLFLLNPCRDYWFDIVSDHRMIRMRATPKGQSVPFDQLHLERGNRLLASLGHLGRQFFDQVYQFNANLSDEFIDNRIDTLLGRIQQDILDLVDRPQSEEKNDPAVRADGTLRIHSCHSPMREVEVLHDQLLDLLASQPDLQPRDILVMTPDIGLYSPYIHAVFGAGEESRPKLPYTVADQSISRESSMIEAFIGLLDLVQGRFEASRVMKLLECGAVCRQFGLSEADLPLVEKWIRTAGIRWGWDAAERRSHHLPGFTANSWRNGLDRLVLGYAMAEGPRQLFCGILPYDGIGAGEGRIVGRLVAFAEAVHESLAQLAVSDSPGGWCKRLNEVLNRLFKTDERSEYELQTLHGVMDQLQRVESALDQCRPIAFEVIRQHIKDTLRKISYDTGFISGAITFCAMLPMRAIPAEVICLLGMNHDAYPREQHEPGFNLIAAEPRSGDRSQRNDDRYLFLETLISARTTFYISYVGQNIQDNAPIPPSVLVDEIVEYAGEGLGVSASQIVIQHPLQAFSPAYFNGENSLLFSYSNDNQAAAEQLTIQQSEPCFFAEALDAPQHDWKKCELEDLASFFAHSARFLLERRLGVFLHDDSQTIEDRENFVLDALARHKINQQILEANLKDASEDQMYESLEAAGALPHGTVGRVIYQELRAEIRTFVNTLASLLPDKKAYDAAVALQLSPYSLSGRIDNLYDHARIAWRMARTRPADLLRTFLFHLALTASSANGLPDCSLLICKDAVWHFGRIENSGRILRDYLDLYWLGLEKPLPLFNRTSFEFAQKVIVKQQPREKARIAALNNWRGNDFAAGESEDAYYRRCFDDGIPLGAEFEDIALKVYRPLFDACRQMSSQEQTSG